MKGWENLEERARLSADLLFYGYWRCPVPLKNQSCQLPQTPHQPRHLEGHPRNRGMILQVELQITLMCHPCGKKMTDHKISINIL